MAASAARRWPGCPNTRTCFKMNGPLSDHFTSHLNGRWSAPLRLMSGYTIRSLRRGGKLRLPAGLTEVFASGDDVYVTPSETRESLSLFPSVAYERLAESLETEWSGLDRHRFELQFYSMASAQGLSPRRELSLPTRLLRQTVNRNLEQTKVALVGVGDHIDVRCLDALNPRFPQALRVFAARRILSGTGNICSPVQLADVSIKVADILPTVRSDVARGKLKLWELSPRKFEEFVAALLKEAGYEVHRTKATRDGGYDILAVASAKQGPDYRIMVECKRYAPPHTVGIEVIRQLVGTMAMSAESVDAGLIATTSLLSQEAEAALQVGRELRKYPLSKLDQNELLYAMGFTLNRNGLWVPEELSYPDWPQLFRSLPPTSSFDNPREA